MCALVVVPVCAMPFAASLFNEVPFVASSALAGAAQAIASFPSHLGCVPAKVSEHFKAWRHPNR